MAGVNRGGSSNPAFRNMNSVLSANTAAPTAAQLQQMYDQPSFQMPSMERERYLTVDDVVAKTATLLGTTVIVAVLTAFFLGIDTATDMQPTMVAMSGGMLVGLVLALIVIFKRSTNPVLIMSYAVAEGVFLGAVTGVFQAAYPGIALQAVIGTLGVFVGMLVVYKTGAIKVTPKLAKMVIGALIGVGILMAANLLFWLAFNINMGLRDGGGLAILFSIVCIVVAAFSFLLDFEAVDQAIKAGAPAKTAWYFSFGLMVTLVWLYIEILRLLSYLRND